MTMKSLRKEFQDLNQQDQGHAEKEETKISTSNDEDKLLLKALYPFQVLSPRFPPSAKQLLRNGNFVSVHCIKVLI